MKTREKSGVGGHSRRRLWFWVWFAFVYLFLMVLQVWWFAAIESYPRVTTLLNSHKTSRAFGVVLPSTTGTGMPVPTAFVKDIHGRVWAYRVERMPNGLTVKRGPRSAAGWDIAGRTFLRRHQLPLGWLLGNEDKGWDNGGDVLVKQDGRWTIITDRVNGQIRLTFEP